MLVKDPTQCEICEYFSFPSIYLCTCKMCVFVFGWKNTFFLLQTCNYYLKLEKACDQMIFQKFVRRMKIRKRKIVDGQIFERAFFRRPLAKEDSLSKGFQLGFPPPLVNHSIFATPEKPPVV